MTKLAEVYKCNICGNIVEMLHAGQGELVCCGQPMNLQIEKTKEDGYEKHLPVYSEQGGDLLVQCGEELHPMQEDHYIEWIEVVFDSGKACRRFLKKDEEPKVVFVGGEKAVQLRVYCNLHGLWVNNLS